MVAETKLDIFHLLISFLPYRHPQEIVTNMLVHITRMTPTTIRFTVDMLSMLGGRGLSDDYVETS